MKRALTGTRKADFDAAISQLPEALRQGPTDGKNGETLLFDEAEAWKRVLDYRVAKFLQPKVIMETHAGLSFSAKVYRLACPRATIYSCSCFETNLIGLPGQIASLIDVDPFGHPYKALDAVMGKLAPKGQAVLMVTNGEMMAVTRGLTKSQFLKTDRKGKDAVHWVSDTFIPWLEERTGLTHQFHYCFPTTVRVILSRNPLPKSLWAGCPERMSWLREKPKQQLTGFLSHLGI